MLPHWGGGGSFAFELEEYIAQRAAVEGVGDARTRACMPHRQPATGQQQQQQQQQLPGQAAAWSLGSADGLAWLMADGLL